MLHGDYGRVGCPSPVPGVGAELGRGQSQVLLFKTSWDLPHPRMFSMCWLNPHMEPQGHGKITAQGVQQVHCPAGGSAAEWPRAPKAAGLIAGGAVWRATIHVSLPPLPVSLKSINMSPGGDGEIQLKLGKIIKIKWNLFIKIPGRPST